ncbi:MAG: OmpA family protein [Rhizobiales bacterium]|nr:OmpA family protein [Hyphomicrobiales bacterium]
MTKRIQLAAMALAAALAISVSPSAFADSHNQGASTVVDAKFMNQLKELSDKDLRQLIVRLKARASSTADPGVRQQLQAARLERRKRRAAKSTPSQPATAAKLTKTELRARKFLRGASPAKSLRTKALEDRIKATHDLLGGNGLQDKTRTRLSNLISGDRTELKSRQPAAQPVSASERQALELLKGPQASTLRTSALQQRIQSGRDLLASGKLTSGTHTKLKRYVAADEAALQARETEQRAADLERRARRHLDGAAASSELRASALRERIRLSNEFLSAEGLRRSTRRGLTNLVDSDRAALDRLGQQTATSSAERRARALLESGVAPDKLNGLALRERIKDTRSLLQEPEMNRRTRLRLQASLDRDLAELNSRTAGGGTNYADQQAQSLLNDTRRPADLSETALRQRLRETRDLLQDKQLSPRYSRRLRSRLSADRQELRRLIARRSGGTSIEVVIGSGNNSAVALLADRRQSSALPTGELTDRVRRTQRTIDRGGLSSYNRSVLQDMLVSDRRELRRRLRARRDRRRAELDRKRRNNQINIVIAPQVEYAPRNDVAAAEADDGTIERQLVAPPTREIDRRYSIDELRRRPDLRHYMPAVEVDSIRFGTNEHFVRAEEIDELERIGSIIERVVATNPGEVFMVEGHTDAVGSDGYNLALSTRRAEAVKEALLEFFVIEPENLATIGYGEQFLKIPTPDAEQENRRVSVRRITPLLARR